MREQWQELKETITEMRDNDGTGTQQEVCKFLVNYMDVLEKQIQKSKTGWHIAHGMYEDRFWCSCGYIKIIDRNTSKWKYCPVCGGTKIFEPQESGEQE